MIKPSLAYVVKYYHPMPRISGILRFTHDLVGALAADFKIRVFTYRYSPSALSREEHNGYEIIRQGTPFPLRAGKAVKDFRPDVIVFGSGLWRPYFLLPYWEVFRAALGRFRGPVILTQYTNMTAGLAQLCGLLCPPPSLVIATTPELKTFWEQFYPGRARYIPPGLDQARKGNEKLPPAPKKKEIRIGYFGHLQRHKGPDILLKVFRELKPERAELLINGEGEMRESLEESARGRDNITIQGYVPDIDRWIESCDLVVLPYRSAVSVLGYSRAALDALTAGIPVVTTANPAVAPLIKDGENGFVCRDETELKEKIRILIEDENLRKKLAAGARSGAAQFDIRRVAEQYKKTIYETL